jgi:hypothetical protein
VAMGKRLSRMFLWTYLRIYANFDSTTMGPSRFKNWQV